MLQSYRPNSMMMLALLGVAASAVHGSAFHANIPAFRRPTFLRAVDTGEVEKFLAQQYPEFASLLSTNDDVWKGLRDTGGEEGYTMFAPNYAAFEQLGEKKRSQLSDPRNKETADKIGAYHVIGETVTAEELFASGGVLTVGGEVPVGRSTSGGLFGLGGKEDGGITVNGARVLGSTDIAGGIVHEVDALISPQLLWRYVDQLRIPGSK